jgi:hypothetical protein
MMVDDVPVHCPHLTPPGVCTVCLELAAARAEAGRLRESLDWYAGRSADDAGEMAKLSAENYKLRADQLVMAGRLAAASEVLGRAAERGKAVTISAGDGRERKGP